MLKNRIFSFFYNNIGWTTERKIVVIESDDWGGIRMPSSDTLSDLLKAGLSLNDNYNRYDGLESEDDLKSLFEVLDSVKDNYGGHPIFTANFVMTNPDFVQIGNDKFEKYYCELFTETYERYGYKNNFELILNANSTGLFHPQFHGHDHLNVNFWIDSLRKGDIGTLIGFQKGFFGLRNPEQKPGMRHFMSALDYNTSVEQERINESLRKGIEIFEQVFKFKPKSFIAPCYTWDEENEKILANGGIKYLQGNILQLLPIKGRADRHKRIHYLGQKNKFKQTYLIRNITFEPSENENIDWVDITLSQIESAFKSRKPAIISTHRVNYIGSIDQNNRERGLKTLNELLTKLIKSWPELEFMTSDQLGELICQKQPEVKS